jgi:hypothetical protein
MPPAVDNGCITPGTGSGSTYFGMVRGSRVPPGSGAPNDVAAVASRIATGKRTRKLNFVNFMIILLCCFLNSIKRDTDFLPRDQRSADANYDCFTSFSLMCWYQNFSASRRMLKNPKFGDYQ